MPVGFLASITRGLRGEELTEMAELRDAGALGFTDDGKPVVSAGMLRKALQYQRLSGGVIALHEEDPALSRDGVMHEGAVSARLGLAGIPPMSESTMVARDAALAGYEDARVHFQHLSCVRVGRGARSRPSRRGRARQRRGDPPPPDADRRPRAHARQPLQDEPAAAHRGGPAGAGRGAARGVIDCVATDHAPHARHEKEVPFEQAAMGTTGLETAFAALFTELVLPGELELEVVVERMTAGGALYGLPAPRIAPGEPANIASSTSTPPGRSARGGYASRSENCCFHGRTLHGRVLLTLAAGGGRVTASGCWSRPRRVR